MVRMYFDSNGAWGHKALLTTSGKIVPFDMSNQTGDNAEGYTLLGYGSIYEISGKKQSGKMVGYFYKRTSKSTKIKDNEN